MIGLVLTAHGRIAALLARDKNPIYGELIDTAALHENYIQSGFAHRSHDPNYPVYGLTLLSPERMLREIFAIPFARVAQFEEGGWGHQDVYVIRKHSWQLN